MFFKRVHFIFLNLLLLCKLPNFYFHLLIKNLKLSLFKYLISLCGHISIISLILQNILEKTIEFSKCFYLSKEWDEFFLTLTHVIVEKLLFFDKILMDFHLMRYLDSEKHFFLAFGLYVCYQHYSKTNCSRNIKFGILHLYYI